METWWHECRSVVMPPQEPSFATARPGFGPALHFYRDPAPCGRYRRDFTASVVL